MKRVAFIFPSRLHNPTRGVGVVNRGNSLFRLMIVSIIAALPAIPLAIFLPVGVATASPHGTNFTLSEVTFAERTEPATIVTQNVVHDGNIMCEELTGTLLYNIGGGVFIMSGTYVGSGFYRGNGTITVDGQAYSGSAETYFTFNPGMMPTPAMHEWGIVYDYDPANAQGRYEGSWTLGLWQGSVWLVVKDGAEVSYVCDVSGTFDFELPGETYLVDMYIRTGTLDGVATGHYNGPITADFLWVEISSPANPYFREGYAVYDYTCDWGTGQWHTHFQAEGPGYLSNGEANGPLIGALMSQVDATTRDVSGTIEHWIDATPPAAVTDLATSSATASSITLTWTAPGDDGNVGTASQYDIRHSTSIITEANWDTATECSGEPSPHSAGSLENFVVTGLSPDTTYYFVLKTADNVPSWSDLSNVPSGTTSREPGGHCFIATAVYGTPMAEEIQILREFRDEYLLTNPVGQALVDLYYRVSPPIAEFITEHPALKPVVRAGLMPAIAMSTVVVNTTLAQKIAIISSLALVSALLVIWLRRRVGKARGSAN